MNDLQKNIFDYLQTQKLMSITSVGEHPWPAIVYFIANEDLELYFLSHPDDLHCQQIKNNPQVACAIYDSTQPNAAIKVGLQYYGEAEVVNVLEKVKWMIGLWNKIIAGEKGTKFNPTDLLAAGKSRIYRIKPKKIKFFNQELFPEEGSKSMIL